MRHTFKKIGLIALAVSMVGLLAGCGSKKKEEEKNDPNAAIRNEIVSFVNEELPAISQGRDEAISVYNQYSTGNTDPQQFKTALTDEAIPKMQTFVDSLTAIETKTQQVSDLKNLYLAGSQKQLDAMNKVLAAINEENPDYLSEADDFITESNTFFAQYESQLRLFSVDYGITINGSFSEGDAATGDVPTGEGSIEVVTPDAQ